jgi:PST family polysaccharide transporter
MPSAFVQRIRAYLNKREDVRRIASNAGWLLSDRALRLLLTLLVSAWVARYLGAEQYGYISIALAYLALAAPLLKLGLDTLVIRFLVEGETPPEVIMGTAFRLRLAAAALLLPLVVLLVARLYPQNGIIALLTAVLALGVLLESFDVIDFWFQSQLNSRYTVWSRNAAYLLTSAAKVAAVLAQAPLMVFGLLYLLDTLMYIAALGYAYRRVGGSARGWRWDAAVARRLLRLGMPLMLSAVAISLYMRIDQLMLSLLMPEGQGEAAVGVYAVAVRLSEAWYFVPAAVVSSVFPMILQTKKQDERLYRKRVQRLFNMMVLVSYAFAIPTTLAAPWIIDVLFGPEYAQAAPQLAVLSWAGVWVALGVARSSVLQAENIFWFSVWATVLGAVVNIVLNWVLIPPLGGLGCAAATFVSYGLSAFLSSFLFTNTRFLGIMQSQALVYPNPFQRQQ